MSTPSISTAEIHEHGLDNEYEHEPVPQSARKSLFAVSAVWVGFPMIMTSAVFGGIITYNLGFTRGILAILVGNLVLMTYVGLLSVLAGRSGKSFTLTAMETFGQRGYLAASGFLATLVIGWFALQTGMVGSVINSTMHWNSALVTLVSGIAFIGMTFIGIRAISWIGVVASVMFVALGAVALGIAFSSATDASVTSFHAGAGAGALSFGVCVTMVVACFADSGTMTSDFTRWSRNGREGFLAALSAFPFAYMVAQVTGAVVVALGANANPGTDGGDFLPILVRQGGVIEVAALIFVFVNLGSVCAHCLYNGAMGWSQLTHRKMRTLTVVLGVIGVIAAVAGVWNYFEGWLSILGVVVPPIGVVILLDQFVFKARRGEIRSVFWKPFAAWALGSAVALLTHYCAPQLSDAGVAIVIAALTFTALAYLPIPGTVEAPSTELRTPLAEEVA